MFRILHYSVESFILSWSKGSNIVQKVFCLLHISYRHIYSKSANWGMICYLAGPPSMSGHAHRIQLENTGSLTKIKHLKQLCSKISLDFHPLFKTKCLWRIRILHVCFCKIAVVFTAFAKLSRSFIPPTNTMHFKQLSIGIHFGQAACFLEHELLEKQLILEAIARQYREKPSHADVLSSCSKGKECKHIRFHLSKRDFRLKLKRYSNYIMFTTLQPTWKYDACVVGVGGKSLGVKNFTNVAWIRWCLIVFLMI